MRYLYLHGFASGPRSKKGLAFAAHYEARGAALDRLDLRVPSFEHLRLSAMIEVVRGALDGPAVVFGSSLGGLTAAHAAARDPRIAALVLLAPAFSITERWRATLGDELAAWQRTGWREVHDFTTGGAARIDYGFYEDAAAVDATPPDVRVPTLILHGRADDVVPIDLARTYPPGRPHVELLELDDGHELVASLPTLLAASDRFLAAHGLAP